MIRKTSTCFLRGPIYRVGGVASEFFLIPSRHRRQIRRIVLAFTRAREIICDLRGMSGLIPC